MNLKILPGSQSVFQHLIKENPEIRRAFLKLIGMMNLLEATEGKVFIKNETAWGLSVRSSKRKECMLFLRENFGSDIFCAVCGSWVIDYLEMESPEQRKNLIRSKTSVLVDFMPKELSGKRVVRLSFSLGHSENEKV